VKKIEKQELDREGVKHKLSISTQSLQIAQCWEEIEIFQVKVLLLK